jgi:hypothetical protein
MKTSKNTLIAGLSLLSLGLAVVAWKSYWRAAQLEAVAVGGEEAASLRRQLAVVERERRVTQENAEGRAALPEVAPETATKAATTQTRGRGGRGDPAAMQAVMDRPEMQRLAALQQKAALDGRYGALFKTLNLSPEKLAAFKSLLAEKEATMMDTMRAAREQGLDPRSDPEGFKKLVATTQAQTDSAIKAAIGDEAFTQYEQYQATQPQRAVVSQLQQSLSYTNAPLTSAQADQMVQVLAATTTAATTEGMGGRGGPMGGGGGPGGGSSVVITAATVAQAQTVLTTTQLQALQDLQALQVAQQQAQKIMRDAGVGGPPPGGGRGPGGE